MTEAERREKFNEGLQALCQRYACMQVVISEDCEITLGDGSRMRGIRDSIGVALLPMENPPQAEAETKT